MTGAHDISAGSEHPIVPGRCYYEKRVGWHWEVWFCHSDNSPDPHSGATEWKASAVKYWRWINAARAANDAWSAFNDGVWIANCRQIDAENAVGHLAPFNRIIAALRYDGPDENGLTVGEIRSALS